MKLKLTVSSPSFEGDISGDFSPEAFASALALNVLAMIDCTLSVDNTDSNEICYFELKVENGKIKSVFANRLDLEEVRGLLEIVNFIVDRQENFC